MFNLVFFMPKDVLNITGLTMNTIKSAWKDFLKGEELPPNLQCLQTIMNRYDYDEVLQHFSNNTGNQAIFRNLTLFFYN